MDLIRIHFAILLIFGSSFLVYQIQFVSAQEEYYAFNNIPDEINATFGKVIAAYESDLNKIAGMASPGLDPRQVVDEEINDERLEDMSNQNFNGNFDEGIEGLKQITSSFFASGSDKDGVDSDEFTKSSQMMQENFDFSTINLTEDFATTLSILNSIAIIVLVIIVKIKLSNKVIVSKPSK